ncbi:unnamed protein product [Soboliphyme baturini]|uniref:Pept_C1 domain-containing protein n=1 Tax=Soboliphyme baturini TaxID=241478 RepID=A0A183I990_9BILA|nr:unnamed protein product [Soboliphyme baturini]
MSDRQCVLTKGKDQPYISDEYLLSCCGETCGYGCNGGWMGGAFDFEKTGIVSGGIYGSKNGCQPYSIPPNAYQDYNTPACKRTCIRGWKKSFQDSMYYGSGAYALKSEASAMQDIFENGPITSAFTVYNDFYYYKKGVYFHASGGQIGGHAIRILGWGEEDGNKYWLCANSWNTTFGIKGNHELMT